MKARSQDFQSVAIQGTLTWHVIDPELLGARVDFSLGLVTGAYKSEPSGSRHDWPDW